MDLWHRVRRLFNSCRNWVVHWANSMLVPIILTLHGWHWTLLEASSLPKVSYSCEQRSLCWMHLSMCQRYSCFLGHGKQVGRNVHRYFELISDWCMSSDFIGFRQELAFLTLILQPALLLIDFGHFQYNSVMLGKFTFTFHHDKEKLMSCLQVLRSFLSIFSLLNKISWEHSFSF